MTTRETSRWRWVLGAAILASSLLVGTGSYGATTTTTSASTTTSALPLFQFTDSGTGPLPWNATALSNLVDGTTMRGNPHAASNGTEGALAYRTSGGDLAVYTESAAGTSTWEDLSAQNNNLPAAAADPIPFFDPAGNVDLLYTNSLGELFLTTPNVSFVAAWHHLTPQPWRSTIAVDLTALTGVGASSGEPSVEVNGNLATVAWRTTANDVETVTLTWLAGPDSPPVVGAATNVTLATGTPVAQSDPVLVPSSSTTSFVTTSPTGDVELYSFNSTLATWSMQDLTHLIGGPTVSGSLTVAVNSTNVYVAALNSLGDVELYTAALATVAGPLAAHQSTTTTLVTTTTSPSGWSVVNVTAATSGAPPLAGSIYLATNASQVAIAGQAANWGDLFVLTSSPLAPAWSATDVSVTGGSAARTVGPAVTGLELGTSLDLFAGGVNSPPPEGVGVYAIPSADWSQAIAAGWPIISETGGLGTQSAPWVGFTSATSVATSPDFLLGQSIYNSHQRVTWLSFWTISGPLTAATRTAANYYSHGFAAGAWVATQIDQYRANGVGLKPDWVILDPEGYPDDHSGLDAPGGSSAKTLATYATYWTSILSGWVAGIASVDPALNAGVYASQSEYANYDLAAQPLPVFEAVAFGANSPSLIPGADGSNIRGYIAFGATCTPASTLASEEATLLDPPWSGQFNTLQFNAGVYCPPTSS